MRKLLLIACALTVLLTGGVVAHAQTNDSSFITPPDLNIQPPDLTQNADGTYSSKCPAGTTEVNDANGSRCQGTPTCPDGYTLSADQTACQQTADSSVSNGGNSQSSASTPITDQGKSDEYGFLMSKLLSLFAWLLGVAAITLENAVYYTVIKMGDYVNGLSAVGVAWRIFRDIGNIVLIFGFVAIGLTTILDVNTFGTAKTLPKLLICAVLLNFSLFAAEAVVDTGNLFAMEFYTQIRGGQTTLAPMGYSQGNIAGEGISNAIMNQLGLQTIYGAATSNVNIFKAGNPWVIGFMGIILFLIAAFVFFSLALILISRFVILVLIIIAAPIGIAGLAIPQLDTHAKKWWDMLIKQTITAPILFLLLYVALAVITDAQFLTGFGGKSAQYASSAWVAYLNGGNGDLTQFGSLILSFLVAMGLLMFVTIAAKDLGARGSKWATGLAGKATFGLTAAAVGFMGRRAAGTAGFVGRRTVGRISNNLGERWNKSGWSRNALVGSAGTKLLAAGGKASFDARNIGVVQKGAKTVGVNLEGGQKGGYADTLKQATERRVAQSKSLQLTKDEEKEKKALQDELDAAARERDEALNGLRPDQKAERKEVNDLYKEKEADIKRTTFEADGKTVKRKGLDYYTGLPQREYAKNLEKPLKQPFQALYHTSAGPKADKAAAKKIMAEATKGQAAKFKDALDAFEVKTSK